MREAAVVSIVPGYGDPKRISLMWLCVGCGEVHMIPVQGDHGGLPTWTWNGSMTRPTLSPSILKTGGIPDIRCHSYVRDGVVEFLRDCGHPLAGHRVAMLAENANPFANGEAV